MGNCYNSLQRGGQEVVALFLMGWRTCSPVVVVVVTICLAVGMGGLGGRVPGWDCINEVRDANRVVSKMAVLASLLEYFYLLEVIYICWVFWEFEVGTLRSWFLV